MSILVCIPHLTARPKHLKNCLRGYIERTESQVHIQLVYDAPSCGVGWQLAADKGLWEYKDIEYIHFSNDDIVVGHGWDAPLIEAVKQNYVPASRIEPAGVHLGDFDLEDPPMAPDGNPPPISDHGYFYSDLQENQPTQDWEYIDHGGLPFCSVEQWGQISPFPPIHFGSDEYFYHEASRAGIGTVARQGSVIYNYCSHLGRDFGDWSQIDMMDFDCVFARPDYEMGKVGIFKNHPLRGTPEGLKLVREWRMRTFPGPHHWEA